MLPFSNPSPSQGVWHFGRLPLRAYALCVIAGIVIATWFGERRWVSSSGKPGSIVDIARWAVPLGIVDGRPYHVATDPHVYSTDWGTP